jgi:hypothetical protein
MDKWKPPTREDREQGNREYLKTIKQRWDRICERLGLNIEEWRSEELLRQAGEAFLHGDAKAQAEAAERIRIRIGYHLLTAAIRENNPGLQSSSAYPKGGMDITERDMSGGRAKLCFFSGTSGERVMISQEGLRLPWVYDEKHYTRTTNMLLREAMKELFSNAQGEDGHELTVSFDR